MLLIIIPHIHYYLFLLDALLYSFSLTFGLIVVLYESCPCACGVPPPSVPVDASLLILVIMPENTVAAIFRLIALLFAMLELGIHNMGGSDRSEFWRGPLRAAARPLLPMRRLLSPWSTLLIWLRGAGVGCWLRPKCNVLL